MIAIGIGCRRGVAAETIAALVREALAQARLAEEPIRLFSAARKHDEPGLLAAADALRLPIEFLPDAALRAVEDRVETRSRVAETVLGLVSVSEAAALAGAGAGARLAVPRIRREGVTCAVATGEGR